MASRLADARRALLDATDDEVARLWAQREAELAERAARPLAFARLWHRDAPRTSQRRAALRALEPGRLFAFVLGGNRSGKSELGAQLAVVHALGREHPDVVGWCALNDVDSALIPSGPGLVYSGALDSNDSRRYVRPKVAALAPPGTTWRNRDGTGEAEARFKGGGRIVFKSVDQGRDGWQGDAARLVHFDEEPNDLSVVNEALMRIADHQGRLLLTMTPLSGWTPMLAEHVREPTPDTVVEWLHGTDNPHVSADFLRQLYEKFGPHERSARERGEIVALEGRVYTDWRRDLHLVPSRELPAEWPRFVGVDFGTRNPTAIVWGALDPADDVLHIYREHYRAEETQQHHARRYLALTGDEDVRWVAADPADRGARLTWLREGVPTQRAHKGAGSVRAQISSVAERLAPDAEGRPHLVVHDCCVHVVQEIESYVWDTRASKGDLPDAPLKRADHAMDALAYLCHTLARRRGLYAIEEEDEEGVA